MRWAQMAAVMALAAGVCRAGAFELSSAENRVVFVGSGLVEQERLSGYVDAQLLRRSPDRTVTCRNLGWSGDSVGGDARTAGYQEPAGLARLIKEAEALRPTVIFVGYGMVESYQGEAGLAKFEERYCRMLDAMQKVTPNVVLLSPTMHEDLGRPMMDPAGHNREIERYGAVIAKIAGERGMTFVDLYRPMVDFKQRYPNVRLTSNGIALNDGGYWFVAREIGRQFGLVDGCRIEVGADGRVISTSGVEATPVEGGSVKVVRKRLPGPAMPAELRLAGVEGDAAPTVRIAGLAAGRWALFVDGKRVAQADVKEWEKGIELANDPDADAAEKLRSAAVRVNEIFYRRSRPFNDHERHWTYIGDDGAQYDKQLADLDKVMAGLRVPAAHEYKFVRILESSHQP